jgi:hypothetical protein
MYALHFCFFKHYLLKQQQQKKQGWGYNLVVEYILSPGFNPYHWNETNERPPKQNKSENLNKKTMVNV